MSVIYVVVLTYSKPLSEIDAQMAAHIEWLNQGYDEGVFLTSGRRIPRSGGVILARSDTLEALQARLQRDPFQQHGLVATKIIPFEASRCADTIQGLLA
ncbi:YciI family protein [Edwardsiella anguillarum]|uniref:YciI family protein n=1 Tax=Edwardsiella anguillarum TaxID=1821960 RepID=UPI0024B73C26|nr:YciI family protein [Edwardsiella anguillarum]WHP79599.1 YciI family protein [Edwardsiella anguillarum]WHQ17057.1 YciI family protein [Edwardsiella anguillarum]WHQ20592.1 YciI family protein [Edwardsiella anguillarum]WHQ24113.1 YciI family protein [Edwardsiella anguillarum]WHQ27685.1 YciI family protein [Edwardsiella anguillarum]